MNLHIVPDSGIVDAFYDNLVAAGLHLNNKFVIRTNARTTSYSKRGLPFAPLYSSKFKSLVGDTLQYERVFIHQLSPLMYRWIAKNNFNEVNWLIWGADLYNLPSVDIKLYEPLTAKYYTGRIQPLRHYLYLLKVWFTNAAFRDQAYSKIDFILTWMKSEFDFATRHISSLRATHKFFFYENQNPYEKLDPHIRHERAGDFSIIIGNSGVAENNHLDVVEHLRKKQIKANLFIPVSYGNSSYIRFLRKKLTRYEYGELRYMDRYMNFEEYIAFLANTDALIMNTIRPQGYGNILMMLYMNKSVFLNGLNISLPDLKREGVKYRLISEIDNELEFRLGIPDNRDAVAKLFSHDRLIAMYGALFGA